jgi:glycosyltransferase involved in cell wall biosynthesis
MLGNIYWWNKGYDLMLELAELIRQRSLPIVLKIAGGQPPHEASLAAAIVARDLSGVVHYSGRVIKPLDWLSQADAFLMLSRVEGTPNALLEAMALGLPCVLTNVGDVASFDPDESGLQVVTIGSVTEALDCLTAIMADPEWAHRLGQKSRAYCESRFSEMTMLDATEHALETV